MDEDLHNEAQMMGPLCHLSLMCFQQRCVVTLLQCSCTALVALALDSCRHEALVSVQICSLGLGMGSGFDSKVSNAIVIQK